ncbi:hypothetical protein [Sphingomonas sp. TZW2008]|uniref:hypothetical protein n=1 Tax=Sphingomonas sp. TZW2008 TaxID=1917973 RepID=UPI0011818B19|nr:hypothetical protein [Sphingomonas sp. TZW2008]
MNYDGRDQPAEVTVPEGSTEAKVLAEMRAMPFMRHGMISNSLASQTIKCDGIASTAVDVGDVIAKMAKMIGSGDLQPVTDTLIAQGIMLDVTATEMMRRAWQNVGEYPEAFNRYMNLALKAQTQSRTALEALARMHQPREQIVRHVHVNEGGQAIVAEQLHMHGSGVRNEGYVEQPHAPGTGESSSRPALQCPDTLGPDVPISGDQGAEPVSNARRSGKRRTSGKQ